MGLFLSGSRFDIQKGEDICQSTSVDVLGQIHEPIKMYLVPDVEHGEVLVDPRAKGGCSGWFYVETRNLPRIFKVNCRPLIYVEMSFLQWIFDVKMTGRSFNAL